MKNMLRISFLFFVLLQIGCNKETRYIYEVEQQELYQSASEKKTLKTTTQFIAIAYNDLFGVNITNSELNKFDIALQAMGDKGIIQDMVIKSLINRSGVQTVTDAAMRADVPTFIELTYLRFFNRKPTEFEVWKMKDLIEKNMEITSRMVYYSLMTSDEYRYY
jgi:hypothetical protein